MKKVSPQDMLKIVKDWAANIEAANRLEVAVGLPKEKIGGKVYGNGMTVIRLGAIHEYGATFMHPGGTPYLLGMKGGKFGADGAKFISKSRQLGQYPETKAHLITIPRRSFLRAPFAIKRAQMDHAILDQFRHVAEDGLKAKIAMGRVGAVATNIVKGAFNTDGYGQWKQSRKIRGGDLFNGRNKGAGRTMVATSVLKNSNTWAVRDAS